MKGLVPLMMVAPATGWVAGLPHWPQHRMPHAITMQASGYVRGRDGGESIDEQRVENMLEQRNAARRERNFEVADGIRDDLLGMNVHIYDTERTWVHGNVPPPPKRARQQKDRGNNFYRNTQRRYGGLDDGGYGGGRGGGRYDDGYGRSRGRGGGYDDAGGGNRGLGRYPGPGGGRGGGYDDGGYVGGRERGGRYPGGGGGYGDDGYSQQRGSRIQGRQPDRAARAPRARVRNEWGHDYERMADDGGEDRALADG